MKHFLLGITAVLVLFSCKKESQKIDQSRIFQKIECVYNEDRNETSIEVSFRYKRQSGKRVQLTENSIVKVNGTQLSYRGGSYTFTTNGYYINNLVEYTDNEGKVYSNYCSPASYISENLYSTWINKNSPGYFDFFGNPIQSGEKVYIEIEERFGSRRSNSISSTNVGNTWVYVNANDIDDIPEGDAECTFFRESQTNNGQFSAAGGLIISRYVSSELIINLT